MTNKRKAQQPKPPKAQPVQPAETPAPNSTAVSMVPYISHYTLLRRFMDHSDEKEQQFMLDLLEQACKDNAQSAAMHAAANYYGVKILVDELEDVSCARAYAECLSAVTFILLRDDWLKLVTRWIAHRVMAKDDNFTPDDLINFLAERANQMDREAETAREVIRDHPELLAKEIQQAAMKLAS